MRLIFNIHYITHFGQSLRLHLSDGVQTHRIDCGSDSWIENTLETPQWKQLLDYEWSSYRSMRFAACYVVEEQQIVVRCRSLCHPHQLALRLSFAGNQLTVAVQKEHDETPCFSFTGTADC